MKPEYEAFARAQAAVDKARQDHETALADLQAAEAAIREGFDRVWQANHDELQAAKAGIEAAVQNLARVELEVSTTARIRDRQYPVLNDDERAYVDAAQSLVDEAEQRHDDAKAQVKAGVTVERLVALDQADDPVG